MYHGKYRSQLTFPKSSKQKSCSNSRNYQKTKNIFQYTIPCENQIFQVFSHFANAIATYVFRHQESIAHISLTLNAKND